MLDDERQNSKNLNFGSSISMKVENSVFDFCIFLSDDDGTDIFALIIDNLEI